MTCPSCNSPVPAAARFCPTCGHPLDAVLVDLGGADRAEASPPGPPVARRRRARTIAVGAVVGTVAVIAALAIGLSSPSDDATEDPAEDPARPTAAPDSTPTSTPRPEPTPAAAAPAAGVVPPPRTPAPEAEGEELPSVVPVPGAEGVALVLETAGEPVVVDLGTGRRWRLGGVPPPSISGTRMLIDGALCWADMGGATLDCIDGGARLVRREHPFDGTDTGWLAAPGGTWWLSAFPSDRIDAEYVTLDGERRAPVELPFALDALRATAEGLLVEAAGRIFVAGVDGTITPLGAGELLERRATDSDSGRRAVLWFSCDDALACSLGVLDVATGATTPVPVGQLSARSARLSPDGSRLVYDGVDGPVVLDVASGERTLVANLPDLDVVWSPDSSWLAASDGTLVTLVGPDGQVHVLSPQLDGAVQAAALLSSAPTDTVPD